MRKENRRERGFLLITLYMMMPLLLVVALGLASRAFADIRATLRIQASTQALYLAEGGIDEAIVQLRNDQEWEGGEGALPTGAYNIQVEELEDDRFRLTSVGSSTFLNTPIDRSVEAIVELNPNPLFRFSLFGDDFVRVTGEASADSYDSSAGPYASQTPGSEGDIGTNGISAGAVTLTGNARVNGNVEIGEGGDPSTGITTTGNAVITGSRTAADEPLPLNPVDVPDGLPNQGDLSISGQNTVILPGGTYVYEDISVSGQGSLSFAGPAVVYVTGSVSISGNGVGTAGNVPPNLIVYVAGPGSVSVSGNGNFYGGLYAPESSVSITGNGAFFGAVVGHAVTLTGNSSAGNSGGARGRGGRGGPLPSDSGKFHYDLALRNTMSAESNEVSVLSWQDVS